MDTKEIQNLIRFVSKSGVSEVKLETKDFKINIKNVSSDDNTTQVVTGVPMPAYAPPVAPQQTIPQAGVESKPAETAQDENANYVTVTSPMIGTFYRKPSPDKPVFVNVGDHIAEGDVVCIIEAMKLFNEIEAEISGKIVKVLVDDASPVEFGQPLFLVDPNA
jgi:acetyl-CoA carboxylase biotin carboxyl carrier protein